MNAAICNLQAGKNQEAHNDQAKGGDAARDLGNQQSGADAAYSYGLAALLYEDAGLLDAALLAAEAAAAAWEADAAQHQDTAQGWLTAAGLHRDIAKMYERASDDKNNPNAKAFDEKAALWYDQAAQDELQAANEFESAAKSFEKAASVQQALGRLHGLIDGKAAPNAAAANKAQQDDNVKAKAEEKKRIANAKDMKDAAKKAKSEAAKDKKKAEREHNE